MLVSRLLRLGAGVAVGLAVAIFLLDMIRPQHLVAGILIVAAAALLGSAVVWFHGDHARSLASRDWSLRPLELSRGVHDEPGFRRVADAVASYLSARHRGDELRPQITALAASRLRERHGLVLGRDAEADRAALGPVLHDYLTTGAASPADRTPERLAAVVAALEAI